jgi:hypothetical protein
MTQFYFINRYLNRLKRKVKNMAAVESSITEAVIVEEVATFCAHFLRPEVRSRLNRVVRNDEDGGGLRVDSDKKISVFTPPGRFLGRRPMERRYLEPRDLQAAALYVIMNCDELSSYVGYFHVPTLCTFYLVNIVLASVVNEVHQCRQYEAELIDEFPNDSEHELSVKTDAGIQQWLVSYVSLSCHI